MLSAIDGEFTETDGSHPPRPDPTFHSHDNPGRQDTFPFHVRWNSLRTNAQSIRAYLGKGGITTLLAPNMKNALSHIAIFMVAIVASEAQGPKKPPILDIPQWRHSRCPECNKKDPVVAEGLSPNYSTKLPECDRIELFLLAEDIQQGTAADRFPIRPDHGTSGIIGRKELKGVEASTLCSLWRGLTFDKRDVLRSQAAGAYGLRFYRMDKLVFETSVTFTKGIFYYPRTAFPALPGAYSWHGFRTYDEAGKALFAFLNATLPRTGEKPKS